MTISVTDSVGIANRGMSYLLRFFGFGYDSMPPNPLSFFTFSGSMGPRPCNPKPIQTALFERFNGFDFLPSTGRRIALFNSGQHYRCLLENAEDQRLGFIRIHRGSILNLDHLLELHGMFGGRMLARLKDGKKTELPVSRDRVAALKGRLGL